MDKTELKSFLRKNAWWLRPLALATLMLAMCLYAVHPLYLKCLDAVDTFGASIDKVKASREWEKNRKQIEALNTEYKADIEKIKLGMSRERKLSALYNLLNTSAKASGVDLASLKPGAETEGERSFVIPFEITMRTDYHRAAKFINELENSGSIIRIKELSLMSPRLDKKGIEARIFLEFLVMK